MPNALGNDFTSSFLVSLTGRKMSCLVWPFVCCRIVMQKNMKTGEESVLFDSMVAMSNMKTPTFRNETVRPCWLKTSVD